MVVAVGEVDEGDGNIGVIIQRASVEDDCLLSDWLVGINGREATEVFIIADKIVKHVINGVLKRNGWGRQKKKNEKWKKKNIWHEKSTLLLCTLCESNDRQKWSTINHLMCLSTLDIVSFYVFFIIKTYFYKLSFEMYFY